MAARESTIGPTSPSNGDHSGAMMLTSLPSALVVVFAPVYIYHNLRLIVASKDGLRPWWKAIIAIALLSTETQLCLISKQVLPDTAQILASCVYLGFLCLVLLLYTEHRLFFKPSGWLAACIFVNVVVDAVKAHSLLSQLHQSSSRWIAIAFQKGLLVILEISIWNPEAPRPDAPRSRQGTADGHEHFSLRRSYEKLDDLPNLDADIAVRPLRNKFERAWNNVKNQRTHSLYIASLFAFPNLFLRAVFLRFCLTASVFSQPFLMKYVLQISRAESKSLNTTATAFALTILVYGGIAVSRSHFSYSTTRLSLSIRGAVSALATEKLIVLRSESDESSAAVTVLNSNLDALGIQVEEAIGLFGSMVDIAAGVVLLHLLLGVRALITALPIIVHIYLIVKRTSTAQLLSRARDFTNQSWILGMSQILSQLKDIKMAGLLPTAFFATRKLFLANADSLRAATDYWTVGHMLTTSIELCIPLVVLVSFLSQADSNDHNTSDAFSSLALATLLVTTMLQLPDLSPSVFARMPTINRIQEFLNCPEYVEYRIFGEESSSAGHNSFSASVDETRIPARHSDYITFSELSVPSRSGKTWSLNAVSGQIRQSQLTMIIGAVGQGKSMLLKAILGEVHQLHGSVRLSHRYKIAYCGQDPWLPNTSIRSAITGAEEFNPGHYQRVIRACDLEQDVAALELGDESCIGSEGSLLSGGQKQRIALARALYADTPVIILDDTFSSLDRVTARRVFARLFSKDGLLRRSSTTTILSTHSSEYLSEADQILAFGTTGTLTRIDSHFEINFSSAIVEATRHSEHFATDEARWDESRSGTYPVRRHENTPLLPTEILWQTRAVWETCWFFCQFIPRTYMFLHFLFAIATAAIEAFPELFVRFWITNNALFGYLLIYVTMLIYQPIVHFGMYNYYIRTRDMTCARLHRAVLNTLLRADIATLTRLDRGDLLSRFTVHTSLLASLFNNVVVIWFCGLGLFIDFTILTSLSTAFAVAMPPFIFSLLTILRSYVSTARQLRLLNLGSKSAVCSQVVEISSGLSYLRAFQWQQHFMQLSFQKLDSWQKTSYYFCSIDRWFRLSLELTILAAALLVVSVAVSTSDLKLSPASVATTMFILMHASHKLSRTMTTWIDMEGNISGISWIQAFVERSTTEVEGLNSESEIPENWPSLGHLEILNVNAGYRTTAGEVRPVLKDISFRLMPGYRIGVVGRTGSGKTSLALTILNSLPFEGEITLDNIDVSSVPPDELRRRITIITQHPVELLGTVRDNLLPSQDNVEHNEKTDDVAIYKVLQRVGLSKYIEEHGGLDALFSNMEFSQGQKQLICLARAILHNSMTRSKLVIIDEATSNMDYDTDSEMQQVMSDSFSGCTMVVIAHRVETLKNVDYLLELEDGGQVSLLPCSERARQLEITHPAS